MPKNARVSTRLRIPGLQHPIRALHLTDLHVCQPDPDGPHADAGRRRFSVVSRDNALVERRAAHLLDALSGQHFDALILTGDLVDFLSHTAVATIVRLLKSCTLPVFFTAGNHDSCFPLAQSSARERAGNLELWSALEHRRPKLFERWELKGLQFLAVDNVHYQIDREQLAFVRRHLATGQPTILLTHIPLTQPRLRELTMLKWKEPILLGETVDDALRSHWNWDPTAPETAEFIALLKNAPHLHAILAGHVHFDHEEPISPTAVQLVGPPAFDQAFRIVEFEPLEAA